MDMFLHFDVETVILFKGWRTSNWWELLLSCLAITLLALLFEVLRLVRLMIHHRNVTDDPDPEKACLTTNWDRKPGILSCRHMCVTVIYTVQLVLAYLLMLVVMTFNVFLLLAVLLGGFIGYLTFGWKAADLTTATH